MTRIQWLLCTVLAAEVLLTGYVAAERFRRPVPPVPDLAGVDPVAADEIRALAARCQSTEQWAGLGEVYLATGYFPEAEACLRMASALGPASAEIALMHAFALERIGKLEEANAQYEAAAARNHPRTADCWYYIGKNHLRRERADAATSAFKLAQQLPAARWELALLDARAGRTSQAEAEARRLSDEFPSAYPPVELLYRLALARNDRPEAARLADTFVRRPLPLPSPFDVEVVWVFGAANGVGRERLFRDAGREMQAGRPASAAEKLRSAQAAGWRPEVADKLADVLLVLHRPEEAVAVLREAVARGGPSFGLLWRLGQAYDAAGQPARVLELWERAARFGTGPGAKGLWEDLAVRYDRAGDRAKGQVFHARAALAAGIDQLDAERPPTALTAFARAVELDPTLTHAWYYLGEAHRANNRPTDARAAYEQCLKLDPDHGRAARALMLLRQRLTE